MEYVSIKSLLFIIAGTLLFLYGASEFLVPVTALIGGFLCINHGLALRNLPPVQVLIRRFFNLK